MPSEIESANDVATNPPQQIALRSRGVYESLLHDDSVSSGVASLYLEEQLAQARAHDACDLPADPANLREWAQARVWDVTARYQAYLAGRRAGAQRAYFSCKAHALSFIRQVAPTKLVDGAWLYWCLHRWQENDFQPLIKTYLEELGEGVPAKNHVALYQKLLDQYGTPSWGDLSDDHFAQGAIQLALGYAGEAYLPETVGYNLGYEQLPLHLLITAYELNELGIDPYYFTLHVTVDNGSTGHAHDAIVALERLILRSADANAFYDRVRHGYKLNNVGESTTSVISAFDLQAELVRVLAAKAIAGKDMHSNFCKVGGRTINEWLGEQGSIPGLLAQLQRTGWIIRGAAPAQSRFWRLIQGERAEMFGVFSAYEQQVLADWISSPADGAPVVARSHTATFRAIQRSLDVTGESATPLHTHRPFIRYGYDDRTTPMPQLDSLSNLEQTIALADGKIEAIAALLKQMTPARHHTATGLMATRLFAGLTR